MASDQVLFSSSDNISSVVLDVSFANAVVLVTLSSFVCSSTCVVLFVYYQWRAFQLIVETRFGIVVFFLGVLLHHYHDLELVQGENRVRRLSPGDASWLWDCAVSCWMCGVVRKLPFNSITR